MPKFFLNKLRLTAIFLVAASFAGLSGCGRSDDGFTRVPVKGKIVVDGQPLAAGLVRFLPDGAVVGRNVEAIVTNGEYSLDKFSGPVPGRHRVEIEATYHIAFRLDDEVAYANFVQTQGGLPQNPIPPQFNRQSKLTTEIPATGNDKLNFDLKIHGGR